MRPSSTALRAFERPAFESLVTATLRLETDEVEGGFEAFMNDCAQPGLTASTYSMVAANALSTLVNVICPYRIDGRAVLTPVGLQMTPAESWKAEASRTAFTTSDDCDGSAAHVTSARPTRASSRLTQSWRKNSP